MSTQLAVPSQGLRDVRRGVAQAADAQVLQVVRMVDALENRGATDAVLEPVRARLRLIQPARPLRFARLLFMPVDPLIVSPKDWRPGTPFLPRTALMVLAHAVRRAIEASGDTNAAVLTRVDGMIANATTAQSAVVRQAGALIWPPAAAAMRQLAHEPDTTALRQLCAAEWAAEGLARAELSPIAASLAPILAHAASLHDHEHALATLSRQALVDMLAAAEREGARAWGMMASLLTIRMPQSADVLLAATDGKASLRPVAEAAADAALAWLEHETADQTGSIGETAPLEVARQAALLDALTSQPGDAARRRRISETKAHLLEGCLSRVELSLQEQLAAPLQALPAEPAARDAALDTIEANARRLRRFEMEARRIGGGARFDASMKGMERAVSEAGELCPMDRARLVEILAGPEAAARQLGR